MNPEISLSFEKLEKYMNNETDITLNFIKVGIKAINKLQLWNWIRDYEPARGCSRSNDKIINEIYNLMIESDHTGMTFGVTMRYLQKLANEYVSDKSLDICAICFEEDTSKKVLLDCKHKFHTKCITTMCLIKDNGCPMCRKDNIPEHLKIVVVNKDYI